MKIIKFTALWCADCIVMRSTWMEIMNKYPELEIEHYDFDKHAEAIKNYQIKKVPHTIIMADSGEELERIEGLRSRLELFEVIEKYLNKSNE